jgi:hypothetical protein
MRVVSKADFIKHLRSIGVVATLVAGGLVLAGTAVSQTVTPQSVDPLQHFLDCAGVLLTAPDIHAANCLPSNVAPDALVVGNQSGGDDTECLRDDVQDDTDSYSGCYDDVSDNVLEPG